MIKKIINFAILIGINPIQIWQHIKYFPSFFKDYIVMKRQIKGQEVKLCISPILTDKFAKGGVAKGHYFHQDLYVAKKIFQKNPVKHIDIGSRVDGFIAHLATFREVVIIDIREISSEVENIEFQQLDMMNVNHENYEICDSISCLHALEHFGLGRYGDPIDIDGHVKGFQNIAKLLKPGGTFYFSTPIGPERIEFNNQRVFDLTTILNLYENEFDLLSFSYVDDHGDLQKDIQLTQERIVENCGCNYGCGIFELKKRVTE